MDGVKANFQDLWVGVKSLFGVASYTDAEAKEQLKRLNEEARGERNSLPDISGGIAMFGKDALIEDTNLGNLVIYGVAAVLVILLLKD